MNVQGLDRLYVLQTQQGSACTTCAHSVLQHYAKDILPPVELCLRGLRKTARTEPVCVSV